MQREALSSHLLSHPRPPRSARFAPAQAAAYLRGRGLGRLVGVWLLLFLLGGCGYRLVRYEQPDGVRTSVAIVTVENGSSQPGVELIASEALRKEFLRRGAFRLSPDPDEADMVIRGRIPVVEIRAQTVSSVVLALEHSVLMVLELDVDRRDPTLAPVNLAPLAYSEVYLASADVEVGRKNRQEALRHIAAVLAERAHDSLDLGLAQVAR